MRCGPIPAWPAGPPANCRDPDGDGSHHPTLSLTLALTPQRGEDHNYAIRGLIGKLKYERGAEADVSAAWSKLMVEMERAWPRFGAIVDENKEKRSG
jgi:hypothetical protein